MIDDAKVPYLVWRGGRPRWVPGPQLRAQGARGLDLKDESGRWLRWEEASAAARAINSRLEAGTDAEIRLHPTERQSLLASVGAANFARRHRTMPPRLAPGQYIYVFSIERRWAKIGYSSQPARRHASISASMPLPLVTLLLAKGTARDERELHGLFAEYRVRNEWFRIEGDLAAWLVQYCPNFHVKSHETFSVSKKRTFVHAQIEQFQ